MSLNCLKIQKFRANDLVDDGGKQFELGKGWCDNFFEFDRADSEVVVNLVFKPLSSTYEQFQEKVIELKLAEVSQRGDRKAYANGENGRSQIKDFFINDLRLTADRNGDDYFGIYKTAFKEYYLYFVPKTLYDNFIKMFVDLNVDVSVQHDKEKLSKVNFTLQQIYYGAPGTGKSFAIKKNTKIFSTIRTTFHPDSDYSTFVGAYKPTMEETPVYGAQGVEVAKEKRITYTYVKQAFLKAYLGAWQKYAKEGETPEPQFLVIEEINRGNCAQIFGDLFQLLDRNDNGFSTYPIEADSDLQKEIAKAFGKGGEYALANGFDVDGVVDEYTSNYGGTLSDDIKNGRVLLLPNNLYIWATMNTSDQSLFPIDSAFKRRWDWRYVKIADAHKGWKIKCGDEYCDWWTFVEEINKLIAKETSSDDKKLGYFFCKPIKGSDTITEDKFVGKVLFYLWNDVFKDGDISLFKVSDDEKAEICFDAFYNSDNKVDVAAIRRFLVSVVGDDNLKSNDEADDEALEAAITGGNVDKSQYSFNGGGKYWKSTLGLKIMETYLSQHKELTFDQIKETFPDSMLNGIPGPGLIVKAEVDLASYSRYYRFGYESSDGIKFSIYKQWTRGNVPAIIEFAKNQNWTVEKL